MDTDAFVREYDVPMHVFLAGLASRYFIREDVGLILAREANITGQPKGEEAPKAAFINTGVIFVQLGRAAASFVDIWMATGYATERRRLRNTWPGEQGLITEYLLPGEYPSGRTALPYKPALRKTFALVNFTEMNSPWGRFVQHSYGKAANAQVAREQSFRDALLRLDCLRIECLAPIRKAIMSQMIAWTPGPAF